MSTLIAQHGDVLLLFIHGELWDNVQVKTNNGLVPI